MHYSYHQRFASPRDFSIFVAGRVAFDASNELIAAFFWAR